MVLRSSDGDGFRLRSRGSDSEDEVVARQIDVRHLCSMSEQRRIALRGGIALVHACTKYGVRSRSAHIGRTSAPFVEAKPLLRTCSFLRPCASRKHRFFTISTACALSLSYLLPSYNRVFGLFTLSCFISFSVWSSTTVYARSCSVCDIISFLARCSIESVSK